MSSEGKDKRTLEDLIELMAALRSEQGCPWDRKQTKDSLKPYIIEESYEVVEAVDQGHPAPEQTRLALENALPCWFPRGAVETSLISPS